MPLSRSTKIVAVSTAIGLAVIGILAVYFRRKKPKHDRRRLPLRRDERTRYSSLSSIKSPLNGDITLPRSAGNSVHSGSPAPAFRCQSVQKDANIIEVAPCSVPVLVDGVDRSPANLCQLGLDAITHAINLWEEAIMEIDERSQDGLSEFHELRHHIEQFIDRASHIQEEYDRLLYHQTSNVALDSALSALSDMNRIYEREHRPPGDDTESDTESFVSASELPDLSDLDDQLRAVTSDSTKLYDDALFAVKNGAVPHRVLRTKLLNCKSDSEFLAKLHCVRLAFGVLMIDEKNRDFFTVNGRDMLIRLLVFSGKDSRDFEVAFENLMKWVKSPQNWDLMEQELRGRGVKQFTFYDVVLDFILMDSFDDLASPPSSVTTITHNRWLSYNFKEAALTTAVWSVLKAKRRMLGTSGGFIARFYDVSEVISPALAWGFLGPDEDLNEICYFFKDLVCDFIKDIFDFDKVSFHSATRLAKDIMKVARQRATEARERLNRQSVPQR